MVIKIKSNELNKDLIYHFNKSNELKDFSNIINRRSIKQIDSIIDDFDISYNDDEKIPSNLHELILKITCKLFKTNKLKHIDNNINLSNSNNYDIIRNYIRILNENFKSEDPKTSTSDESIKKVKADYISEIKLSKIKPEIKIDSDEQTKIELLPTILGFPKILESKIDKIIKEKISKKLKEINDRKKKDNIADLVKESKEYIAQMYPIIITLTNKKQDDDAILIALTNKKQKQNDDAILIALTNKKQKQNDDAILIALTNKKQKQIDDAILIALTNKKQKQIDDTILIALTNKKQTQQIDDAMLNAETNKKQTQQIDDAMLIALTNKKQTQKQQIDDAILIALTNKKQNNEPLLIKLIDKKQDDDDEPLLIKLIDKKQDDDDEPLLIALTNKR